MNILILIIADDLIYFMEILWLNSATNKITANIFFHRDTEQDCLIFWKILLIRELDRLHYEILRNKLLDCKCFIDNLVEVHYLILLFVLIRPLLLIIFGLIKPINVILIPSYICDPLWKNILRCESLISFKEVEKEALLVVLVLQEVLIKHL